MKLFLHEQPSNQTASILPNPAIFVDCEMVRKIIFDLTFDQNIFDRAHIITTYERHNQEVIRAIPSNRLLIFQASQGWAPLCQFLEKPIPDVDFPHVNSSDDFVSSRPDLRSPQSEPHKKP